MNSPPRTVPWLASIALWMFALVFLVLLYVGLYAGYNSTLPIIGKPSPSLMLLIRFVLGTSLAGGVAIAILVLVWGNFRQRVVAVPPKLLFLFVVYFLAQQFVATWWRQF